MSAAASDPRPGTAVSRHEVEADRVRTGSHGGAASPSGSVMPQILTNGARPSAAGSTPGPGTAPAATKLATRASTMRRVVPGPHEVLAHERGIEADGPPAAQRRRIADAGFRDHEPVRPGRGRAAARPAPGPSRSVRRSRLLMPMSRASVATAAAQLRRRVRLHQRLEAELERQRRPGVRARAARAAPPAAGPRPRPPHAAAAADGRRRRSPWPGPGSDVAARAVA